MVNTNVGDVNNEKLEEIKVLVQILSKAIKEKVIFSAVEVLGIGEVFVIIKVGIVQVVFLDEIMVEQNGRDVNKNVEGVL